MTAPDRWTDPELEDLFREDRALHQTARLLRASRPEPTVQPDFQQRLRTQLMEAASARPVRKGTGSVREPRSPRRPFWMRLRASHFAMGGAGLGAALTAATVVALVVGNQGPGTTQTIVATSPVAADHLVSPNNTILVSFNQPMDHAAVVAGLRIEPATQVTTTWQGNQLVITPVHHLAGNTPYTVTIPQTALVASSGAHAAAAVQISFGTAPTAPPIVGSQRPPQLTQSDLGPAADSGLLLFAPDGGVVTNALEQAPATPIASPPASPSATPGATPASKPPATTASAEPTPTPGATATSQLVELPAQPGTPLVLGPAATAAAFSPDGSRLATVVASSGGSDVTVSRADGTDLSTLTHSATPVVAIAWASGRTVEFATTHTVMSVDLGGDVASVAADPPGSIAGLAPGGAVAYLTPTSATPGRLLTLAGGEVSNLAGNQQAGDVTFSGDGSTVAWIDRSADDPLLMAARTASGVGASVSILDPSSGLAALALNRDGTEIAYDEELSDGSGRLVVAQLPSGAPVAVGAAPSQMVFAPDGGQLAARLHGQQQSSIALEQLPGASEPTSSAVPAAASQVLHAFLDAQVAGNQSALQALSAPGVVTPALLLPGLSRASLIDAVEHSDRTVDAIATLVADPTATRTTALAAEETLSLKRTGGSYVVNAVNAVALHALANGPHVISVTSTRRTTGLTAQIGFDSDLDPATVAGAITVQDASGNAVPVTVTYDENARTATVNLSSIPSGAVSIIVGAGLRDVNGQAPGAPFTAPLVAG